MLTERKADDTVQANAYVVLDACKKAALAQVHDVSGGRYAAGLDIELDRDGNFDSRIRTLFHERCHRLGHYLSTLVPKPGKPPCGLWLTTADALSHHMKTFPGLLSVFLSMMGRFSRRCLY